MATRTVVGSTPTPSRPSEGFRTDFEGYFVPGEDEHEPALIINPAASRDALMAAARSRVRRLQDQLRLLSECEVDPEAVKLGDAFMPLWALSQEASLLLSALDAKKERGHG